MKKAIEAANEGEHLIDTTSEGMALLQDCMLTYLVAGDANSATKIFELFVERFGHPRPQAMACAVIAYCHADSGAAARPIFEQVETSNCDDLIVEHARACLAVLDENTTLAREALARARAGGYVEMRFCDNEDSLLSPLASQ